MADLLDKLHVDAGLDLLRADGSLTVYPNAEGHTPANPVPPYVRAYVAFDRPADAGGNALIGLSSTWTVRWYLHCVGANEYAATAVGMRVRAALLDQRPTIAGRNCGLIREDSANVPIRDSSTGVEVFDYLVIYRLQTTG